MHSVVHINPKEPHSPSAPGRKDKGSDSFSLLLETTARKPDDPAPEPKSPGGEERVQPSRRQAVRRNDDRPEPRENASQVSRRPDTDRPLKSDEPAADKDSIGAPKQAADDDKSNEMAETAATPDATKCPQPAAAAVGVSVSVDVPEVGAGIETPLIAGEDIKIEIEVAAGALAKPTPPAEAEQPSPEGVARVAAAIGIAAKTGLAAGNTPPEAEEIVEAPKIAAAEMPGEKPSAEAKPIATGEGGERPKPGAVTLAHSAKAATQIDLGNIDENKPVTLEESAATRLAVKPAPDTRAPDAAAPDRGAETPAIRQVSFTPGSQHAIIPEPLRNLAATLNPQTAQLQAAASAPGVLPTSAAIAIEIAARAREGSHQFDIRLDPPELGRIDVRLNVEKSGEVSTRLTVDRPETLDLLQRDARGLERALQSAGLKTEDGSLQFSLRHQAPDGSGQQAQNGADPVPAATFGDEEEAASAAPEQYQWAARLRGGVDIRV